MPTGPAAEPPGRDLRADLGERLGGPGQRLPAQHPRACPSSPTSPSTARARFGTAHWKLDAIEEYAGDRPLAWIDDSLDAQLLRVGRRARGPHPAGADRLRRSGSRRPTSRALESWAADGYTLVAARRLAGSVRSRLAAGGGRLADHLPRRGPEDPGLLRRSGSSGGPRGATTSSATEDASRARADHGFRRWRREPKAPARPRAGRPARRQRAIALPRLPAGRPRRARAARSSPASPRASRPTESRR